MTVTEEKKNSSINRTKDLSDGYVVLGSGLSAISTIHAIIEQNNILQKKIYVVDVGLTKDSKSLMFKEDAFQFMPSPKFRIKSNGFVYKYFNSMLGIVEKNFFNIGSFAKGGLSNIWGATIQPYNEEELKKFPYTYNEIKGFYSKVLKILTNKDSMSSLYSGESHNGTNTSSYIHKPLLAINKAKSKSLSCELESCDTGCINCNKNIFNSANEIDFLKTKNKIEYLPGLFIKSIYREKEYYYLNCSDITTGDHVLIKAKIVFSCLGTISTTKIVLGMENKEKKLPLLNTPGGALFLFSFKRKSDNSSNILSSQSFSGWFKESNFNGNIYPISKNLIEVYFGIFFGKIMNFLFWRLLFSRLFIANLFFPSNLSSNTVSGNSETLIISSSISHSLKTTFKASIKTISSLLLKEKFIILPFGRRLLAPGQDIHYGGTLPMKKEPKEYECNLKGELEGFKNFFITDSSSLPYLPGKGQSFNSMVNSFYITTEAIKNEK